MRLSSSPPWMVAFAIAGVAGCATDFPSFTVSPSDAGAEHAGGAGAIGGASTSGSGAGPTSSSSSAGGAAGAGGSAGGAAGCSAKGTNTAIDDFEGPDLSALWGVPYETKTTFAQTGGKAVITLADQQNGSNFAGIYTILDDYDLRECDAIVEIVEAPDTSAPTEMYFFVGLGTNADGIVMAEIQGSLTFTITSAPDMDASTTFDPMEQKWWRIRHETDTIHFETSKDAKAWTEQHTEPAPSWIDHVKIDMGAGTQYAASPGLARFDNLNHPP